MKFFKGLLIGLMIIFVLFVSSVAFVYRFNVKGEYLSGSEVNRPLVSSNLLHTSDVVDNDYVFNSSDFLLPCQFYRQASLDSEFSSSIAFINFSLSFSFVSNGSLSFTYTPKGGVAYDNGLPYFYTSNSNSYFSLVSSGWNNFYDYETFYTSQFSSSISLYFRMNYNCDSGFTPNVSRIEISFDSSVNGSFRGVNLKFFDVDNHCFWFQVFGSNATNFNSFEFFVPERTLYVNQNLSSNEYYQAGYDNGVIAGDSAGYSRGYDIGYGVGYGVGDNAGYIRGSNDANTYTFDKLIGAVVDAPVSAFTNLLNFTFLGFNFLSFVTGLLTIGFVFIFARFVFFRK